MKIVFNMLGKGCGLGNNGGSRTLIKCAETLLELKQDVVIQAELNEYTWHKPKVKIVIGGNIPKCDVVIASGYGSVESTVKAPAKLKYYYLRGFEIWRATEDELFESYRKLDCLVNSEWLRNFIEANGIKTQLVYPGLDLDLFFPLGIARKPMVGGLFSNRHKTKRHNDIIEIASMLNIPCQMLNKHIVSPSDSVLNKWYNTLKVWIAPTELEGLHNPPMEAGLTGCPLVCTDHYRSGMQDYVINEETALVYPARNLYAASECVKRLIMDDSLRNKIGMNLRNLLIEKIGTREKNMKKLLEIFKSRL